MDKNFCLLDKLWAIRWLYHQFSLLTYTLLLRKVGRMYSLNLVVKGLNLGLFTLELLDCMLLLVNCTTSSTDRPSTTQWKTNFPSKLIFHNSPLLPQWLCLAATGWSFSKNLTSKKCSQPCGRSPDHHTTTREEMDQLPHELTHRIK